MRHSPLVLVVALAMLFPAGFDRAQQKPAPQTPPQQEQTPQKLEGQKPIISVVNLVDVLFTVLNRRNKLVTDLTQDDFQVLDEGQQQSIRYFSRQSDLPLRIGVMMDTSNSIRDRLKFEQEAATEFLFNVLRRGKDQAFLMTFDDEPNLVQDYTDDPGKLRDQIFHQRAGGGTAVYDAIYKACLEDLSHPPRPAGDVPDVVRRVMILISDGEDNLSGHTRGEAIETAQRTSVVIYTISTSTQWATSVDSTDAMKNVERKYHKTEGDKILEDLAEETGGRAFFPYRVDDLDQSFQDIGDELRSQYTLAYNPTNYVPNGKYHKIHIKVDRKGLQIRHRRGYYARKSPDAPNNPGGN
jgi:VWFA-related protein